MLESKNMLAKVLDFYKRLVKSPDTRRKIIITFLVLAFYRLISHIPAAGVDLTSIRNFFVQSPILSLLDVFSGGTLANFSILALGLNPYINASIVMQLLTYVVPSLEALSKEGEYGQEKVNQYSRLISIPVAIFQSFAVYSLLINQHIFTTHLSPLNLLALVLTMTAGSMISLWLGEIITQYGIGNGVSFLIFAGIVSRIPVSFSQSYQAIRQEDVMKFVVFAALALLVIAVIVLMNEAVRQIPIVYSRVRSKINQTSSFIPLRLNQAGVIPIIFAVSLILLPSFLTSFLSTSGNAQLAGAASALARFLSPGSVVYNLLYFILVVGFTYFYTSVVFNPEKLAENLQKSGGFVPGIRPGSQTVTYLGWVLNRVTLAGAVFLGVVAVLPSVFQNFVGATQLAIGGTGVLIVVSVVLELVREIESQLVTKKYSSLGF
jgi:preprotein translocase subunit SecY